MVSWCILQTLVSLTFLSGQIRHQHKLCPCRVQTNYSRELSFFLSAVWALLASGERNSDSASDMGSCDITINVHFPFWFEVLGVDLPLPSSVRNHILDHRPQATLWLLVPSQCERCTKIGPIVVIVHNQCAGVVHDVPNFNGVNYFKNMIGRNNVEDALIVPELRMVRLACAGALRVRAQSIIHSFYRRTMMLIMVTSTTPACAPVAWASSRRVQVHVATNFKWWPLIYSGWRVLGMDLPSSSSVRNHVLHHHQAKLLGASNTFVPYAAEPDPGADVHCLPNFFMDDEVTIKYE